MKYRNLLILGASGGTGRQLATQALEKGYSVTILVRPGADYEPPSGASVLQGEVLDPDTLANAAKGKDAVLSCLGIRKKLPASPWTRLLSPKDFCQASARAIVKAMENAGVRRVIAVGVAGANESFDQIDGATRLMIRLSTLRVTVADAGRMEDVFRQSKLDWLVVRPVRLIDGPPAGRAQILEKGRASDKIARADVASWMLEALERDGEFQRRTEMIGWG